MEKLLRKQDYYRMRIIAMINQIESETMLYKIYHYVLSKHERCEQKSR